MQIFGTREAQTIAQLTDVANRAVRVALMADGRVGFTMPIVVRKGATPAFPGQMGFIGGSMGDGARRHDRDRAYTAPVDRRNGGRQRVRPVHGLIRLAQIGDCANRVRW
jgi:hypothetical protein